MIQASGRCSEEKKTEVGRSEQRRADRRCERTSVTRESGTPRVIPVEQN